MVDVLACAVVGALLPGDAGSAEAAARPVDALFGRTYFRELALAPDGRRALVFEVEGGDASHASLVELRFGDDESIERLVHPIPDDVWGQVVWDPSGTTAAFLRAAPPRAELWCLSAEGALRCALPPGVSSGIFDLFWREHDGKSDLLALHNLSWPNSGGREAALSRIDLEKQELGEVIARFGVLTVKEAVLAPDGRTLALVATETPSYSPEGEPLDLYVLDLETKERTCLTSGDAIVARPAFAPDSRKIACTLQRARTLLSSAKRDVVLFDVESGRAENLTSGLEISIGDGVFGAGEPLAFLDERTLLTATQHGLADHLLAIELAAPGSNEPARCRFVREGPFSWQKLAVAPSARRVIAVDSGPAQPERIVTARWPRMEPRVVEAPNDAFDPSRLGAADVVRFTGAHEWPMEGVLVLPAGMPGEGSASRAAPWPTIIVLHGGSSGRSTLRFNDGYLQTLALLGYAAFAPNLRGSSGYGVEFNRANEGDFGGKELDDLDAAVAALIERGVADPKRLFLLGHSYGGFLAEMALVRSRKFAAACAASGVSDWNAFVRSSDLAALAYIGLGGGPDEQAALYAERSPLRRVEEIKTPLLLVHGARDGRVPISQSEWLDAALRRNGTPSQLIRLPSVGHLLRGPDTVGQWLRAADVWFRAHSRAPAAIEAIVAPVEAESRGR